MEHLTDKSNINVRYFDDLGDVTDFIVTDEALQPREKGKSFSLTKQIIAVALKRYFMTFYQERIKSVHSLIRVIIFRICKINPGKSK